MGITIKGSASSVKLPCPRCGDRIVEQRGGSTVVCERCEKALDEFDLEARRLLTDDKRRSWYDVERDVAAALRHRAGRGP